MLKRKIEIRVDVPEINDWTNTCTLRQHRSERAEFEEARERVQGGGNSRCGRQDGDLSIQGEQKGRRGGEGSEPWEDGWTGV